MVIDSNSDGDSDEDLQFDSPNAKQTLQQELSNTSTQLLPNNTLHSTSKLESSLKIYRPFYEEELWNRVCWRKYKDENGNNGSTFNRQEAAHSLSLTTTTTTRRTTTRSLTSPKSSERRKYYTYTPPKLFNNVSESSSLIEIILKVDPTLYACFLFDLEFERYGISIGAILNYKDGGEEWIDSLSGCLDVQCIMPNSVSESLVKNTKDSSSQLTFDRREILMKELEKLGWKTEKKFLTSEVHLCNKSVSQKLNELWAIEFVPYLMYEDFNTYQTIYKAIFLPNYRLQKYLLSSYISSKNLTNWWMVMKELGWKFHSGASYRKSLETADGVFYIDLTSKEFEAFLDYGVLEIKNIICDERDQDETTLVSFYDHAQRERTNLKRSILYEYYLKNRNSEVSEENIDYAKQFKSCAFCSQVECKTCKNENSKTSCSLLTCSECKNEYHSCCLASKTPKRKVDWVCDACIIDISGRRRSNRFNNSNKGGGSNENGAELYLTKTKQSKKKHKSTKGSGKAKTGGGGEVPLKIKMPADCIPAFENCQSDETSTFIERQYEKDFEEWKFTLSLDHNLLFYGFGSKKTLLENFSQGCLSNDGDVISIDGFHFMANICDLLDLIADKYLITDSIFKLDVLHPLPKLNHYQGPYTKNTGSNITNRAALIAKMICCQQGLKVAVDFHSPIYLIVHNIDGYGFRNSFAQMAIANLFINSEGIIRLVASIDDVSLGPLLWDQSLYPVFNWIWQDTTTYRRYMKEVAVMRVITKEKKGKATASSTKSAYSGILDVLQSVSPRHVLIAQELAKLQLKSNNENGIKHKDLFAKVNFAIRHDSLLRTLMTELFDHQIITRTKDKKDEYIKITSDDEELLQSIVDYKRGT